MLVVVAGAFSSTCDDFGRRVQRFISLLCFTFFFFLNRKHQFHSFKTKLSLAPIPLLRRDKPTLVQRAETTVDVCSLTSYVWARFPDGFPLCLDSIVSPLRLLWVKGVCEFMCEQLLALLAEWQGSFKCSWRNEGVKRTLNRVQKVNSKDENCSSKKKKKMKRGKWV